MYLDPKILYLDILVQTLKKIRGNKAQRSQNVIFQLLKISGFRYVPLKTITMLGPKLGEIVPWVQAFKSDKGITFILFLRIFKARKPQKIAHIDL